jgi:hypothetical protein
MDWFKNNSTEIVTVLIAIAAIGVVYFVVRPRAPTLPPTGLEPPGFLAKSGSFVTVAVVVVVIALAGYLLYTWVEGSGDSSGNLATTPVSSTTPKTVPAPQAPPSQGPSGGAYGLQFWAYIQDWNYKFGETKSVIVRQASGDVNPSITLAPNENSLQVTVSLFPTSGGAPGSSTPAPSNSDGSATDGTFTCTISDVPLQSWFCVSVSLDGRALDLYLNGKMVRSCVLPGVPKPVLGDLEIMPNGGFSGKVIDVYHTSRALAPSDAAAFYAKGTNGSKYTSETLPSKSLFGYNVSVGVFNPAGTEVKKFVL